MIQNKMSISLLKKNHPDWSWKAVRGYWFGWNYEGTLGERYVYISPYAVLSGYCEDDYETVWKVKEKDKLIDYFVWRIREENENIQSSL